MRYTALFGRTLRQPPSEAETASHRFLLQSGMVVQVAAGVYAYMPLAWRSLQKIEAIIRSEMNAAGGQELKMPTLQPVELWEETGRRGAFGPTLMTVKDRRERTLVLAPTHEEVITTLVKTFVQSYRDLPLMLYQIQTKFRDEARPRGGLLRVREFDMKDAYSFDMDVAGADRSYEAMARAYRNIFARCGLPALQVEADSGAIGGRDSHEFILPSPSGEDTVITCPRCGYAANAERAVSRKEAAPRTQEKPLEEVPTPGARTIPEVAAYLGVPEHQTLKAVFYTCDGEVVFVTIRGDREVNEVKLKNLLKCRDLRLASDEEVQRAGLVAGAASPIGITGIRRIADETITMGSNFVVGANKPERHYVNANYPRDFQVDVMADIALSRAGDPCVHCGTPLESARGIEVGHIFKLGTAYSQKLGAYFLDREGQQQPTIMGCYGIGVGRTLAAAIEQNHDDKGIIFPPPIAPFQVYLAALNADDPQVAQAASALHDELEAAGVEVLLDDRSESAGVKFNDADLLGFPVRVVVSPRGLKQGTVEVKRRKDAEAAAVPAAGAVARARELLATW